jgi:hypothetical protein
MKIAFINLKTMFFFTILAAFFIVAFAGAEDIDEKKGVNKVDAALEKYRVIVNEMVNRPTEDLEAIFKFNEMAGKFFKEQKLPVAKGCPAVESDALKKKTETLAKVRKFEEMYKDILKGGLVFQNPGAGIHDNEFPNLLASRNVIIWMLAMGVMDIENGDFEAGFGQFNREVEFQKGMLDTPVILCAIMGSILGEFTNLAVAQVLPKLNEEQLTKVRNLLSSLPNSGAALVNALKADFTVMSDNKEEWIKEDPKMPKMEDFKKIQVELVDQITAVEAYLKGDGKTEMPKYKSWEFWPNANMLMSRVVKHRQHRIALIKAIDKTLLAKKAGEKADFSIPYDEGSKIVVKGDYGCMIQNK